MNIVAVTRVKNEARWIYQGLQRTLLVAERAFLLDDHSTDNTRELARAVPGVQVIESPFTGLDEARDKEFLLAKALASEPRPDWVVFMDGDEIPTVRMLREMRQIASGGHGGVWQFRIAHLWNRPDLERVDGIFARFMVSRIFSVFDQPELFKRVEYMRTLAGGNFHCGQVPNNFHGRMLQSEAVVKHYGYVDPADRQRKYEWYNKMDPNNQREGCYAQMIEKPSPHAPGPVRLVPFMED